VIHDVGEAAFFGFDDRTGMVRDQAAQQVFGVLDVAQVAGAAGFSLAIILIILESAWVPAAAGALVISRKSASGAPAASQPPPRAIGSRASASRSH